MEFKRTINDESWIETRDFYGSYDNNKKVIFIFDIYQTMMKYITSNGLQKLNLKYIKRKKVVNGFTLYY